MGLDLDAYRAESEKRPFEVTLGGKTFVLPAELPIEVPEHLGRGEFVAAIRALFGPSAEDVLAIRPPLSVDEVKLIVESYRIGLGEASASSGS